MSSTRLNQVLIDAPPLSKSLTSIGSPSAVPVPCASSAHSRLACTTDNISRRCDDPLGAVRLALGPSCCTAVPETSAAWEPPNTKNAPEPSPRQYPSARESKVWHQPKAESIPPPAKEVDASNVSTVTFALHDPAHSLFCNAVLERWNPTNDVEQAVSTVTHGPVSRR